MYINLSTEEVSIKEFDVIHEILNKELSYKVAASREIQVVLVKRVIKELAVRKVNALRIKYSKIDVERVFNDPSLSSFDPSKPIVGNFSVHVIG